ncbi:MAG: hypothetical protein K2X93_18995, partial [Candidatus Obscuribacterales bacterium]|nr:hypothetical protein [Candidatus Obscuribacterales bacterium]
MSEGYFSLQRLIKTAVILVVFLSQIIPIPTAFGQTRRLPKAQFQRFSGYAPTSDPVSSGAGLGGLSGTGLTTPGVHLTTGEERNARNMNVPYNPGEPKLNMGLVRWKRTNMPLKVWISPGLMLPPEPFEQLENSRVELVFNMMKDPTPNPLEGLPTAPGWTEEMNYQVAAGIEQWRQFENEGLLSFGFTSDPRNAQILVFFNDQFKGAAGPGGTNVGALTMAQLFTPAQQANPLYKQKPVIMEFSTAVNHLPEKMQASAAHEFG